MQAGEAFPPDGDGGQLRRAIGAAAGHHVDLVEDLEVPDGRHDDQREQQRPQHRQRDVTQHLEGAGAVHPGRLLHLRRDRLEAGQQRQGHERERLPDHHHADGDEGRQAVVEPGEAGEVVAQMRQRPVHEAVLVVEHPAPHDAGRHPGHGPRQQHQHAEQPPAPERLVEEQRHRQAGGHRRRHAGGAEHGGGDEDLAEMGVGEERPVVLEADEAALTRGQVGQAGGAERQPDRPPDGVHDQPEDDEQRRGEQQPGQNPAVEAATHRSSYPSKQLPTEATSHRSR